MAINSLFTAHGSPFYDLLNLEVNKNTSENSASSSFNATLSNFSGRNKSNFAVGDEVAVYATTGNIWSDAGSTVPISGNRIFLGILEDIKFAGKGNNEVLELTGRDYSARLQDRTVEPEVYSNLTAGSIVLDIINKYTTDLTTSNVQVTGSAITKIKFNQTPVFDAVKQLADLKQFVTYVDEYKDLHFKPLLGSSTGRTFDSGNVISADFKTQRDTIYNEIWVYGDRYLDGYKETLWCGSPNAGSPLGGSIFNLLYKPHNTQVTVSGAIIQPGGIYQMVTAGSLYKYVVDYDNAQIIFTSGTTLGANIPTSGNTVIIDYKRELPIVKTGTDDDSINLYGKRVKVIKDKNIKDPNSAVELMKSELAKYANPIIEGNLKIKGLASVPVGQTAIVNFPNQNINNQTYNIIAADYDLSKENLLSDKVLNVKVNRYLPSMENTIRDIIAELKKLQTEQITDSDLMTRFKFTTGSLGLIGSYWEIQTRDINNSFIIGHPINGRIGSYSTHVLGDYRGAAVTVRSGGYY